MRDFLLFKLLRDCKVYTTRPLCYTKCLSGLLLAPLFVLCLEEKVDLRCCADNVLPREILPLHVLFEFDNCTLDRGKFVSEAEGNIWKAKSPTCLYSPLSSLQNVLSIDDDGLEDTNSANAVLKVGGLDTSALPRFAQDYDLVEFDAAVEVKKRH